MKRLARRAGYNLLRRGLRKSYRRIEWVGPNAKPPEGAPVIVYANHHVFHDGYALGYVMERVHGRRVMLWFEDYHRFPFLGMVGAMPFPRDDARERFRTIRKTAKAMKSDPTISLIYFPEGHLHRAEEGIRHFDSDTLFRLARAMPDAWWWPVGLHVTGWNEAHPTLVMGGGPPHRTPTGSESETLADILDRLVSSDRSNTSVILDGHPGPNERWDFSPFGSILPKR